MELIIFEYKMWTEIPEQDNPAFDYLRKDPRNVRREECVMITKALPFDQKVVGKDGYVVIYVPLNGDVIKRGLFWELEFAEKFGKRLVKEPKVTRISNA